MTFDIDKVTEKLLLELRRNRDILSERISGVQLLYNALVQEHERLTRESSEPKTNN